MTRAEALKKYEPLLWKMAMKVSYDKNDWEDLVSVGRIAILEAMKTFDPKKATLMTYIHPSIRQKMTDYRIATSNTFYCSRGYYHFISQAESLIRKGMSIDDAMKECNTNKFNRACIRTMVELRSKKVERMDMFLDREDKEDTIGSMIDSGERTDEKAFENIEAGEVQKVIEKLPRINKIILKMYYGIKTRQRNLREIGKILGLTRERVRQIRDESLWDFKRGYIERTKPA